MLFSIRNLIQLVTPITLAYFLSACGHSNNSSSEMEPDVMPPLVMEYQVTLSNLTNGQPFSPIAVILHGTGEIWQLGQPASVLLENLAESGDNSGLINADFVISNASNGDILLPGSQTQISISTTDSAATYLSLATMLVNSNDAFTGLSTIAINQLEVGDSLSFNAGVYDAGTEGNSEMSGTIPGPADGGEGFNVSRDDVDYVAMHPGIVSLEDGLNTSVLTYQHRFDNPAMSVKIVRMQ